MSHLPNAVFEGLQNLTDSFNRSQQAGEKFTLIDAMLALGSGLPEDDDTTLILKWVKENQEAGVGLRDAVKALGVDVPEGENYFRRMMAAVAPVLRARSEASGS